MLGVGPSPQSHCAGKLFTSVRMRHRALCCRTHGALFAELDRFMEKCFPVLAPSEAFHALREALKLITTEKIAKLGGLEHEKTKCKEPKGLQGH